MNLIESINLVNEITVKNDRFVNAHGKSPSGSGNWHFTNKPSGKVDYDDDGTFFSSNGSIADAKKKAMAWAKKNGHTVVYVMEENETEFLEEGAEKKITFNAKKDKKVAQFKNSPSTFIITRKGKHGDDVFVYDSKSGTGRSIGRMVSDVDAFLKKDYIQAKIKTAGGIVPVKEEIEQMENLEEKKLDKVDPKELKGKHSDRDDKDIDNDGDSDDSDEYLHKRRKAIKKALNR